jgi:hypothetical protein
MIRKVRIWPGGLVPNIPQDRGFNPILVMKLKWIKVSTRS